MSADKPVKSKSRVGTLLMIIGAVVLIASWAIGLPDRFRASALQSQSETLTKDMDQLRRDIEQASKNPTASEYARLEKASEKIEERFQEHGANLNGEKRFEGLQLLALATACVLISVGLVLKVFQRGANQGPPTSSDSDDHADSDNA